LTGRLGIEGSFLSDSSRIEPGTPALPFAPNGTWVLEHDTKIKLRTQQTRGTHRFLKTDQQNKNMKYPQITNKKKRKKSTIDFTNFDQLGV
jgi:hypothetical protein